MWFPRLNRTERDLVDRPSPVEGSNQQLQLVLSLLSRLQRHIIHAAETTRQSDEEKVNYFIYSPMEHANKGYVFQTSFKSEV